jgi:hypothetical protein
LRTQFEITTSTLASATGSASISPSRNSTLSSPVRSRYAGRLRRALLSMSGVMSTPITRPDAPTFGPATTQSKPPPEPRSSTTSPARSDAILLLVLILRLPYLLTGHHRFRTE